VISSQEKLITGTRYLKKTDRDPEEDISTLVEVDKNGLDVSLGNELEQFADFVIVFKDEQAEDLSREPFL